MHGEAVKNSLKELCKPNLGFVQNNRKWHRMQY